MNTLTSQLSEEGILTVTIDVPKESMNVLNQQVMNDFDELLEEIIANDSMKAVIICSGKDSGFIAGADIKMLSAVESSLDGSALSMSAQRMLSRISQSSKPFIAAIHGACLGAGYELALACHYRIASDAPATQLGLPEVMLGLLPGATGNTKLPRLIDLPTALDLLLTGKSFNSRRALKAGMIDERVAPSILLKAAEKAAHQLIKTDYQRKPRPFLQRLLKWPLIHRLVIRKARQEVLSKTHGLYPAPLEILKLVQTGLHKSVDQALALESEAFGKLTVSPQAKELIRLYFASNDLKKFDFTGENTEPTQVNHLGVLGGGLMGAGIATVAIEKADVQVRIKDIRDDGILSAYDYIERFYKQRVQRKILTVENAKKKVNQLTGSLDYRGFEKTELVIEAVFESLDVKQQMVADIEALGNENIVFASNTSSIPISEIASKAQRPENILGMHYFSPVEKMPLLEIIKHPGTSTQALATAVEFGRRQGKTVIVVKDAAGFYVNRILTPYINAALFCAMEGVALDKIDQALFEFGFPVGPIKLLDEVGLDVGSKIQPILEQTFGERMASPSIQQKLIDAERLGKKVKKGFYRYDNPKHSKTIDQSVYTDLGISPKQEMANKAIVERCVYMMLNEAARALEDGVIDSVRDGDIGAIFGIGFPPFLGGPFRYMDEIGLPTVVDTLKQYQEALGPRYQPAELLVEMSEQEKSFYPTEA